ncbi:phosphoribosylformimino-5-aminoimidazole carboxamide ribotide isomerase [Alkaliphilus metalliredigens QYMF]|uniref:1-(5-phosphoribosyl)-5-[(5-phosphoribosylamino)methylideneamino] imidazole-4-carboxamide isomerase n=1 Tax=Alkaliphilus metalliredigens (strain QYMF) TaxID=293826 RepID=HIS4_ALKMQ|nr:1-(5-phosphoribosyl)-5-[(5-phosphoribosylamino)methylideneamino]imidazole-4-carboxamide isomerase [Alkaliphilus metalliredigens]A6TKT5.1 RecName: Full=1-(5-phosphoribosyl)-5-[(5-phosphoribosylamino)methylideneamino] imidazole-4-carboxamide isomerase; AltName: Full=Phosphoribosylformimino-5-aminoimidazole carboxamide ribotide isomerase [Alkaliphilus metalliredigens QYMF]ABR46803.1 phosphoribosylformimino-5-aminoimidazole carboxamide ribotide isomerase [Alkaliphilus metalliredigens QYMF]
MIIYPAIDIQGGQCVRLTQGKKEERKMYFDSPQAVAQRWQAEGAEFIHVVDLDGAFGKGEENMEAIEAIVKAVEIPIQVGGGIRSIEKIQQLLDLGVTRVILGTKALTDEAFLREAIEKYGDRIIVSIDAKEGYVATEGWVKTSSRRALDFAKSIEEIGVKRIVYTDIAKDGMLQGPNFDEIQRMKDSVGMEVIASGGISCETDLQGLKEMDVKGVIVGKALYEGKVQLGKLRGMDI